MPKLLDEGRPPICDLVSIDGAHTYQNVLADVTYLSRLARPGAPFLIDDVCDPAGCETERPSVRLPCRHVASLWLPCPHQGPAWQTCMTHETINTQVVFGPTLALCDLVQSGLMRVEAARYERHNNRTFAMLRAPGGGASSPSTTAPPTTIPASSPPPPPPPPPPLDVVLRTPVRQRRLLPMCTPGCAALNFTGRFAKRHRQRWRREASWWHELQAAMQPASCAG